MASLCLLGGLLFVNLGVLGLYVGKTFDEAKKGLFLWPEKYSIRNDE